MCNFNKFLALWLKAHLLLLVLPLLVQSQRKIECPLVWQMSVITEGFPSSTISSTFSSSPQPIIRGQISGSAYGGRVLQEKGYALLTIEGGRVENVTEFEVLTNPHGCTTTWQKSTDPNFQVGYTASFLVGRLSSTQDFFPGQITSSGRFEYIGEDEQFQSASTEFEYLTAYSKGLKVEVTDFQLHGEPFGDGNNEILGIDIIHNAGDAQVVQSVLHRKRVLESVTITTREFSNFSADITFKIQSPEYEFKEQEVEVGDGINGTVTLKSNLDIELGFTITSEDDKNSSFFNEKESQVTIEREVVVPPYNSLQICTIINIQNDFHVEYTAKARYYGPGLAAQRVENILGEDGVIGVTEGDSVVVEQNGILEGTLYLTTKFFVVPIDPHTNEGGCSEMAQSIYKTKKLEKMGLLDAESKIKQRNEFKGIVNSILRKNK